MYRTVQLEFENLNFPTQGLLEKEIKIILTPSLVCLNVLDIRCVCTI